MPWCPKCKNEYVEGIEECKKCHCRLVDHLIQPDEILAHGEPEHLKNIAETLKNNGIISARVEYDPGEEKNFLLIDAKERTQAVKYVEEMMRVRDQLQYQQMQRSRPGKSLGVNELYQNKKEQAEEVKASAYALIIVGFVGLVLDALFVFGMIPMKLSTFTKTVTCSVMGFLFLCLIVMGFWSVKSFKSLLSFAKEEDKITDEIKKWYQKELSAAMIDGMLSGVMDSNLSEEEKYFPRMAQIRQILNNKFMNLDPAYADNMAETIYQELYEHED